MPMNNKTVIAVILIIISACGMCFAAKEKNIIKFGRDVTVEEGRTVRSVASVIGDTYISGTAEDDVIAIGGSVFLGKKSYVGGNIVSVGGVIDKKDGAQVDGNIVEVNIPGFSDTASTKFRSKIKKAYWELRIISIFGLLLLSIVMVAIIPKPIEIISTHVEKNTVGVISWSIKGLMLIVPLAVILTMSLAGIFLIPLEVVLVAAATLLGYIAVSRVTGKTVGELFNRPELSMYLQTAIGVLIISFLGLIPVFGLVVKFSAALIGFGAVLTSMFDKAKSGKLLSKYFNPVNEVPQPDKNSKDPS
jgi:hypothetical protein